MKLCIRDIFVWREARWRLLRSNPATHSAFIIAVENRNAWPTSISLDDLSACERETATDTLHARTPSTACARKLEGDWARLQQVLSAKDDLFDSQKRQRWLVRVAEQTERCPRTLETFLRRYWQRGLTKSALLSDFEFCGRSEDGTTGGRGRRPRNGRDVYQLTTEDTKRFDAAISYYFEDNRRPFTDAYQWLLENYYSYEDANGNSYLMTPGESPSKRQFARYFKKKYSLEKRLRKRHGEKEFKRTLKANLSDTIADCLGIGHTYEIDATIADVPVVLETDRGTIIGKATVYFNVDRKSRLIAGFYVGLENPCWETAVESILSLVESKEELCARYGVHYDPNDWPADGILPSELLGDHGEMISKASTAAPDRLHVSVANPESRMPNFKPNVETRFKFKTAHLRNIAPGYEPPENFGKRQTENYDKEACLTLYELIRLILEAIIKHNRSPLTSYPRSVDEIMRGVEPSPISLWNDNAERAGCLGRRFDEATVRAALLPRATAKFTNDGLLFQNLYYASDDPRFVRACVAANKGRSAVTVSYDRRTVDCVYVHLCDSPEKPIRARLSERNHGYGGLSFREAAIVHDTAKDQIPDFEQTKRQVAFETRNRSRPTIQNAERERDELGALSVQSRNANKVSARAEQKRQENLEKAARQDDQQNSFAPRPENLVGFPVQRRAELDDSLPLSAAAIARQRMR